MAKPSVEQIKDESRQLRGSLAADLASEADHFDEAGKQLLKFHGIYQQDSRDARKDADRKKAGLGKLFFFFVRSKLPGGKLSAEQYLTHDELSDRFGNGTMRITSRQGMQIHGVFKGNLKAHLRALNEAMVSTLAACGDVERNVMCCPAPIRDNPVRDQIQATADRIAEHLCPRTSAYHDIWLNGEKLPATSEPADEPIYGKTYLPRKLKTGIALPEDNCIDVLANDVALLVKHDGREIAGYDVFTGGGMGMSHNNAKTYPRLATPLCFATPDELLDVITAIVKVQRDHGNREDRLNARMKYLIDRWGQEKFHATVEEYYGKPLAPHTGATVTDFDDHLGWHDQGDGKSWVGVHVLAGRVKDDGDRRLRTGLRAIVERFRASVRLTAQQDILLCDLSPDSRTEVDRLLDEHGIRAVEKHSNLVRHAMACPALPTCGLALSESERVLPEITAEVDGELAKLGLGDETITLRTTGCPNGCARPYNCDIGIVGRSGDKYVLFLGGNPLGTNLSFQYQDLVPRDELMATLRGPLRYYKQARNEGEGFGDFCHRVGADDLRANASDDPT